MHFPLCLLSSYVVNMGLIDKLYGCFLSVQGPVDEQPKMSAFLQQASALLHSMCKLCFVVTGRWACFLLVTHFDIFVISWSSSDNRHRRLSVQVMTAAESLSFFFFWFCFFWTVKRIHKNGSLCYSNKSVIPLQSASRSFTPVSKLAKLSLLKMEIGIYLTQCSVTHHKP